MPNKILFVLCEGPHDVAFIYRITTVPFKLTHTK